MTEITSIRESGSFPDYVFEKVAFIFGVLLLAFDNLFYFVERAQFINYSSSPWFVYSSLIVFLVASALIASSGISYLLNEETHILSSADGYRWALGKIISDVFLKERKLLISTAVIYGLFFAFLDGVLVYQPGVDFYASYVVNGVTWRTVMCCGLPGYVPLGLLYLPAQHMGLELIPVTVLLMALVSILVALNVALLFRAYRLTRSQNGNPSGKGVMGGVVGAAFGLFVGCPTCAAAFFLSMIAGTGSLAFSTFISAYQPEIMAITLPLLLFSLFWQARSIRTILQGCKRPPQFLL